MKSIKLVVSVAIFYLLIIAMGTPFAGCTKEKIVRDTITIHDTTTVKIHDTASCYNLNDGLVALYTFNNGSLKDSSGNNNHIIFSNATPTSDRFGRANNAYLFNGVNNYMRVQSSVSLNPNKITIMAIVKANDFYTASCHANQVLGKGYPDYINGFYEMRFQDLGATCSPSPIKTTQEFFSAGYGDNNPLGKGAGASADTSFMSLGKWYNVIYTYDGIESRIYVNGVLKDVKVKTVAFNGNSNDLYIGRHEDPQFPYLLNGAIDEIRIYNKAVCPEEVDLLNKLTN